MTMAEYFSYWKPLCRKFVGDPAYTESSEKLIEGNGGRKMECIILGMGKEENDT